MVHGNAGGISDVDGEVHMPIKDDAKVSSCVAKGYCVTIDIVPKEGSSPRLFRPLSIKLVFRKKNIYIYIYKT